jgi:hypothetical protein
MDSLITPLHRKEQKGTKRNKREQKGTRKTHLYKETKPESKETNATK